MAKRKLEDSAIFQLDPKRALEVLTILDMLKDIGKLNSKEGRKNWITEIEWQKTQVFFLSECSRNLPKIREMLNSRKTQQSLYLSIKQV
jgi:hypothetical protein